LYDLTKDPGERHDLTNAKEPPIRAERSRLAGKLESWMTKIGDNASTAPTSR